MQIERHPHCCGILCVSHIGAFTVDDLRDEFYSYTEDDNGGEAQSFGDRDQVFQFTSHNGEENFERSLEQLGAQRTFSWERGIGLSKRTVTIWHWNPNA